MKLRVLDLFSGIGGFSLGLERTGGFETVAFCEIESFPRKVLRKHWPEVPIHDEIRTITKRDFGPIDVVCGGFPCQPFSHAGKRDGTSDDRYLWPEMLATIRHFKPTWVIAENVAGLASMGFELGKAKVESRRTAHFPYETHHETVYSIQERFLLNSICEDLDGAGYDVQPFVVPACAVDAKHRRDRIWIMAHTTKTISDRGGYSRTGRNGPTNDCQDVADTKRKRQSRQGSHGATSCEAQDGKGKTAKSSDGGFGGIGPTKPGLGGVADGVSNWLDEPDGIPRVATGVKNRAGRLSGLGNAVVPQVVYEFGMAILEVNG